MGPRPTAVLVIALLISVGGVVDAAVMPSDDAVRQAGGGDGGMDGGGDGGMDGGGGGPNGDGPGAGRANVSVDRPGPGMASVRVRNAAADDAIRIRFERAVGDPETGLHLREMAVRSRDPDFDLAVRVSTRAGADVEAFPHSPAFGYLEVTHTVPNANVTNASLTFALDRTRLRERTVSADDVRLYRYRTTDRTWQTLETRVIARNESQVICRAESPGLSAFAVAPAVETPPGTSTPTATATSGPTATETAEPTATRAPDTETTPTSPTTGGDGAGFGAVVAVAALAVAALLAVRRY